MVLIDFFASRDCTSVSRVPELLALSFNLCCETVYAHQLYFLSGEFHNSRLYRLRFALIEFFDRRFD